MQEIDFNKKRTTKEVKQLFRFEGENITDDPNEEPIIESDEDCVPPLEKLPEIIAEMNAED